jgi:hypothetical protein
VGSVLYGGAGKGLDVARAPELVVKAMRQFPGNRLVQQLGCYALTELHESGLVRAGRLNQVGAWGVVASAVSIFQRDDSVARSCCLAVTAMSRRGFGGVPAEVGEPVAVVLFGSPDEANARRRCHAGKRTLWVVADDLFRFS